MSNKSSALSRNPKETPNSSQIQDFYEGQNNARPFGDILTHMCLLASLACTAIISGYNLSSTQRTKGNADVSLQACSSQCRNFGFPLTSSERYNQTYLKTLEMFYTGLRDPSPATLAAASLIYTLTTSIFHHLHKEDTYQNEILLTSVVIGRVWSWIFQRGYKETVGDMALCVSVSLAFSATMHWIARILQQRRHIDVEDNEKIAVEIGT